MDEPAPPWLSEAIAQASPRAEVVNLSERRPPARRAWRWTSSLAAAAVLLLAMGIGWSLHQASPGVVSSGRNGTLEARGALARALDVQLASAPSSGIRIGLTFRAHDRRICRTFSTEGLAGVACRAPAGWTIAEVSSAPSEAGAYRMAGETPAQMAVVDSLLAEGPFGADAEKRLARHGWR